MPNKLNEIYFSEFPTLETERLILRKATQEDASLVFSMRSNPVALEFLDSTPHKSHADGAAHILKNEEMYKAKEGFYWIITSKLTKEAMGDFAIWRMDKPNFRGEIGYCLFPSFWKKGFMSEAMEAILLHSFEANINPKNENSRKLLLRFGFEKEAYFKENYFFDGKFLDSEIYCLLEKNFIKHSTK